MLLLLKTFFTLKCHGRQYELAYKKQSLDRCQVGCFPHKMWYNLQIRTVKNYAKYEKVTDQYNSIVNV